MATSAEPKVTVMLLAARPVQAAQETETETETLLAACPVTATAMAMMRLDAELWTKCVVQDVAATMVRSAPDQGRELAKAVVEPTKLVARVIAATTAGVAPTTCA